MLSFDFGHATWELQLYFLWFTHAYGESLLMCWLTYAWFCRLISLLEGAALVASFVTLSMCVVVGRFYVRFKRKSDKKFGIINSLRFGLQFDKSENKVWKLYHIVLNWIVSQLTCIDFRLIVNRPPEIPLLMKVLERSYFKKRLKILRFLKKTCRRFPLVLSLNSSYNNNNNNLSNNQTSKILQFQIKFYEPLMIFYPNIITYRLPNCSLERSFHVPKIFSIFQSSVWENIFPLKFRIIANLFLFVNNCIAMHSGFILVRY